jgi:mannose-6-phosphate isomerase-like protein (cupin superfamily)
MKLNFDELELKVMKNFNGGEKELQANMYIDETNKIFRGRLIPGASIGYHKHEMNEEVIYIIKGNAKFLFDDTVEYVKAGECHFCPKGHSHSFINETDEDIIFFAVVPTVI